MRTKTRYNKLKIASAVLPALPEYYVCKNKLGIPETGKGGGGLIKIRISSRSPGVILKRYLHEMLLI